MKKEIEYNSAAQLYAQKFLSYIVAFVSSFVIFLEVFFNIDTISKFTHTSLILKGSFLLIILCLFLFIGSFGILTYRTSIEMYVLELKIGTIPGIFDLVRKEKDSYLYKITNFLFISPKRKLNLLLLFIIVCIGLSSYILFFYEIVFILSN